MITGGGTGIGLSIATSLAREGAHVVLCGRRNDEVLEEARAAIELEGGSAFALQADVTDSTRVRAAFDIIESKFGGIDVLVNNAGVLYQGNIVDFGEAAWDETLDVNLKGAFLCSKHALPQLLRKESGIIMCVSSMLARFPYQGLGAYSASKAALIAFSKALSLEVDSARIKVWTVCPGATNTPMLQKIVGDEELGSAAAPEAVAQVCLDLITGKRTLASGTALLVDGHSISRRLTNRIRKMVQEFG